MKSCLLLPFAVSCALPLITQAEEYEVLFHRAATAGQKVMQRVRLSVDDQQQFTMNGKPLDAHTVVKVELVEQREDVRVDENGYATEQKLTVQSCQCIKDGKEVELFKPKDEVVIQNGTARKFTVNGTLATDLQAMVLDQSHSSGAENPGADDRTFSPHRKVKVGDTWPMNSEEAAKGLSQKLGTEVSKDAFNGTVKLESVETKNALPCLHLVAEFVIKAGGLPLPGAPPGLKTSKFETTYHLAGDFPMDLKREDQGEHMSMESVAEGGGTMKNGSKVTFTIKKSQTKESEILPP